MTAHRPLAMAFVLLASVAFSACARKGTGSGGSSPIEGIPGAVELALTASASDTAGIKRFTYRISAEGLPPIAGVFDVDASNGIRASITNLQPGLDYLIELAAMSEDGRLSCAGTATVSVLSGQTTLAAVTLQCRAVSGAGGNSGTAGGAGGRGGGAAAGGVAGAGGAGGAAGAAAGFPVIVGGGEFDRCPVLRSYVAVPSSAAAGGVITLTATAVDGNGDPLAFTFTQSPTIGTLTPAPASFGNGSSAMAALTCTTGGSTTISISASDGRCKANGTIPVTCRGAGGAGGAGGGAAGSAAGSSYGGAGGAGTGGIGTGGVGTGGLGSGGVGSGGLSASGGATQSGGAPGSGGIVGSGGDLGTGGAEASGGTPGTGGDVGTGGIVGSGGGVGSGGDTASGGAVGSGGVAIATGGIVGTGGVATGGVVGTGGSVAGTGGVTASGGAPGTGGAGGAAVCAVEPTECPGQACSQCTTDNCVADTDGCQFFPVGSSDHQLCEAAYKCFTDPANDCTNQGDPLKCWCGTNPTTCLTDNAAPTQANGPCLQQVFAAAKSTDAATIRFRFADPGFPLGGAVNLTVCRGGFCSGECGIK